MNDSKLLVLLEKVDIAYKRQVEICGDLYNLRKELNDLISEANRPRSSNAQIHNVSDFEYIQNQSKWYISNVISLDDFGDTVTLVEFTNKHTNEIKTLNPNGDSVEYGKFINTNCITGSEEIILDQVKVVSLAVYFSRIIPKFIHTSKHSLIDVGKLGFIPYDSKVSTINELTQIIPKTERVVPSDVKVPILNSHFIESIENLTITIGNGKEYVFTNADRLIDYLSSHLTKRSNKALYRKTLTDDSVIYNIQYTDQNGKPRGLYLMSAREDLGYRNYHTWCLTHVEMLELRGKHPSAEYKVIELI